ncbi:hypothetical protein ALC57_08949 [Trachymyrmex cornetzi]|uniref:Uncharacterized protein n=1 Tax=Trachymyrmex cornetzi TaxID=471704 RepID=A0A151J666_9HYME|nr:hypothetical protein ALC57_08949 [Trachymyrmex cornetzi]
MLFDSLTFLERHITQRRSFSNVNFIKLSGPSSVSETSLKTQRSMIPQEDHEIFINNDSNHTLISKERCNTLSKMSVPTNQPNLCSELNRQSSIPSSRQTFASDMEGSAMVSPSCFLGKQAFKKRKIDPMETAFHQMNNTLSTMANKVCSRRTPVNDNDADVLIRKLITTELQRAIEPHKSELKQKLMV